VNLARARIVPRTWLNHKRSESPRRSAIGRCQRISGRTRPTCGLVRDRIRAYNEATGGENTDSAGYHETITRFFVWRIGAFVAAADCRRPIDDLADELIRLLGDKNVPLEYYSRERIMSVEARRGWIEPDLQPLQV
jgi:hypothetical protein